MAGKKDAIAIVYAQALLELAFEKGTPKEILDDLREVIRALKADPRALDFLCAPHIRRDAKKQLVDHAFGSRVSEVVTNFAKVLIDKGRQEMLPKILAQFEDLYHERQGELVVHVESAVALDDREQTRLKAALKKKLKKEIILDARVKAALIGGVVIRVGDTVVDGSLRHRLAQLASRLEETRMPAREVFGQ